MQQEHAGRQCLCCVCVLILIYRTHNPLGITSIANIEYVYLDIRTDGCLRRVYGVQTSELRTNVSNNGIRTVIPYQYGPNYGSVTRAAA